MNKSAFDKLGEQHQDTVIRESLLSMCDIPRIYLMHTIDMMAGVATPDQMRDVQRRHESIEAAFRDAVAGITSVQSLKMVFKFLFLVIEQATKKDGIHMPTHLVKLNKIIGE